MKTTFIIIGRMDKADRALSNGPDTKMAVRKLPDGRVELRHMQWAKGLGWYSTQRIVLELEALPALHQALRDLDIGEPESTCSELPDGGGQVICLQTWRKRR